MKKLLAAALAMSVTTVSIWTDEMSEKKTPFIEYNNRMVVFDPLHQAYERIKPNALYAGVEGWLTLGLNRGSATAIAEAEFRMGYNFFYNGRDHITPFAGVGVFKDCRQHHFIDANRHHYLYISKHSKPPVVYGVIGVLYDHEFNSIFNLGVNLKGIVGGPTNRKHFDWGVPVLGFDVSLPITFRFGRARHWDFRLEPFDIYMHGQDHFYTTSYNYFGFRSTIGYRF